MTAQQKSISIKDAAQLLGVSRKTLRRWEDRGILIPKRTKGGHRRYNLENIKEFKKEKGKKRVTKKFEKKKTKKEVQKNTKESSIQKDVFFSSSSLKYKPQKRAIPQAVESNNKKNIKTEALENELISKSEKEHVMNFRKQMPDLYKSMPNIQKSLIKSTLFLFLIGAFLAFGYKSFGPQIKNRIADYKAINNKLEENISKTNEAKAKVLAAVSFDNTLVRTNVEAIYEEDVTVNADLAVNGQAITTQSTSFSLLNENATTLGIGGGANQIIIGSSTGQTTIANSLIVEGEGNDIAGTLNLSGNNLTSSGDLIINPTGGGVSIGDGEADSVDLEDGDLFVSDDLEVDQTAFISSLSINGDTFTDLTGTGLQISGGELQTTLGDTIESADITDGTITETDLSVTNTPTDNYFLSYDASSGGFTWIDNSSFSLFTDGGTVVYLTTTSDSLTVGSTTELAKIAADGDADEIQLLAQANSTQTNDILVVEQSDGTDVFSVGNTGNTTLTNSGSSDIVFDLTSTGDLVIQDNGTAFFTFSDAGALTQAGSGQVTFTGNVDAGNGLDVTGATFSVGGTNATITTAGAITGTQLDVDNLRLDSNTLSSTAGDLTLAPTANLVFSGFDCSGYSNGGALTADASGVITCSADDGGGGGTEWTSAGGVTYLVTTANSVNIGGSADLAKLSVDGDTDEIQFLVQGAGTQNNNLAVFEQSDGTNVATIDNSGNLAIEGSLSDISQTVLTIDDDLKIGGNDIVDSGDTTRVTIGDTTTLTNTTTTFSGTTTINGTSVTTVNLGAATVDFNGAGIIQYADGSDFTIRDDGTNNILSLNGTTNEISFGNATDNNTFTFLGTGQTTFNGNVDTASGLDVTGASLTVGGNATITTAGVITGTQLNIDNLRLDGNLLSSTSGDVDITPVSGSNLDIDIAGGGELQVDGGLSDFGSGTYSFADGDNDVGIAGDLEVLGTIYDSSGTAVTNYWSQASGSIYPANPTVDLLIGGTATSSATFAFTNVDSGDPTATIAGNLALVVPSGSGPAAELNVYNGGTFNIQQSVGGDAGLATSFYIDANGNIGIGTDTPDEALELSSGSNIQLNSGNLQDFGNLTFKIDADNNGSNIARFLDGAGTPILTIDESGLLSVTPGAALTTAVDLTDTDLTNALSIGDNNIIGTTAAIDFSEFDVSGSTGSITIDDDGNAGSVTVEGTALDIDSLDFAAAGAITTTGADLTLTSGGDQIVISDGDFLNIGGVTSLSYNAISDSGTASTASSDNDLFIEDILEVGNVATISATLSLGPANQVDAGTCDASSEGKMYYDATNNKYYFCNGSSWGPIAEGSTTLWTDGTNGHYDNTEAVIVGADGAFTYVGSAGAGDLKVDDDFEIGDDGFIGGDLVVGATTSSTETIANGSFSLGGNDLFVAGDAGIEGTLYIDTALDVASTNASAVTFGDQTNTYFTFDGSTDAGDTLFNLTGASSGITTGQIFGIAGDTITTGDVLNISADGLTDGRGLYIESTSTGLTSSGSLAEFKWAPGSADTSASDLFVIDTNGNATVTGELFAVKDNASDVFTVGQTGITSAVPHEFTASGDVSIAYDLVFTNQTSSNIQSYGPLTIESGESFENNDLNLTTYGTGNVVVNLGSSGDLIPGTDDTHDVGSSSNRWDDIYATNGTIQTSDLRTKENIENLTYGLETLNSLRPVSFNYIGKEEKGRQVGLIAQEVLEVIPEVVDVPDEPGGLLGIRYSNLVPIIINSIQDQQNEIEPLLVEHLDDQGNIVLETNNKVYSDGKEITKQSGFAKIFTSLADIGNLNAKQITTNAFTSFQGTVDKMLVKVGLVSPEVLTKTIKPLEDEKDVAIQVGNGDSQSGFGKLLVQNSTGETVASIDENGNANFEGQVTSEELEVEKDATISGKLTSSDLETQNASVAGELRVGKIIADEIVSDTQSTNLTLDEIKALLDETSQDQGLLGDSQTWNTNTATDSANLTELAVEDLYVTNQAAINALSVTESVVIGSDLVIRSDETNATNTIDTLNAPLSLQASASQPLSIMAGLVRVDTNGDVQIAGDLAVGGTISSSGLTLQEKPERESEFGKLLSVFDKEGSEVAGITATGSAQFKSLETDIIKLKDDKEATSSSGFAGITYETKASAGTASIPAGSRDVIIKNPSVNENSLIFVTPKAATSNKVIYIKEQTEGEFVIGFDTAVETEIEFNWWIVGIN